MSKNIAFIGLGGNEGDRLKLLHQCKKLFQKKGFKILSQSSVYETPPWGFSANQNFYNQVIKIETENNPFELFASLQLIEIILGRKRKRDVGYESRTMDIDILFFNDLIINEEALSIPHARLHLRKFVLVPMLEIAADFVHPKLKLSIQQLMQSCEDDSICLKVTS